MEGSVKHEKHVFTIVGHGEDGDLSDGAVPALHATSTLVDGGQIGVHVTREASATRHLFTGSRHLQDGNQRATSESKQLEAEPLRLLRTPPGSRISSCQESLFLLTWSFMGVNESG